MVPQGALGQARTSRGLTHKLNIRTFGLLDPSGDLAFIHLCGAFHEVVEIKEPFVPLPLAAEAHQVRQRGNRLGRNSFVPDLEIRD